MSWNIGLKDKIGSLSHNAGVISLQPSLITIGGRQYKTTSVLTRTISVDVTLIANSLYMIYAQVIAGVVVLRISTSVRSGYLILNPQAELVGAFYSDGLASISLGSFVNIYGPPETNPVSYLPVVASIGTITGADTRWCRKGPTVFLEGRFQNGTVTGAAATMNPPTSLVVLASVIPFVCGSYGQQGSATGFNLVYNSNNFIFGMANWAIGATGTQLANGGFTTFSGSVPITGWSNTQLLDL